MENRSRSPGRVKQQAQCSNSHDLCKYYIMSFFFLFLRSNEISEGEREWSRNEIMAVGPAGGLRT
jgi:hypothetical protein